VIPIKPYQSSTDFTREDFVVKTAMISLIAILFIGGVVYAGDLVVTMHATTDSGTGEAIGTITVTPTPYGTLFTPDLKGLSPGVHGFHVHEKPACGSGEKDGKMVPGLAAGGHYDPAGTGRHEGPYGKGHLGDLPALYVDQNGLATHPELAPRVKISDLKGRSLIIHAGGDNYSDAPEKLGGGGARIACGIVE
jgi:Cu-Zn family superoxide dismutase